MLRETEVHESEYRPPIQKYEDFWPGTYVPVTRTWICGAKHSTIRMSKRPRIKIARAPNHDPRHAAPIPSPITPPQDVIVHRAKGINSTIQNYLKLRELESETMYDVVSEGGHRAICCRRKTVQQAFSSVHDDVVDARRFDGSHESGELFVTVGALAGVKEALCAGESGLTRGKGYTTTKLVLADPSLQEKV